MVKEVPDILAQIVERKKLALKQAGPPPEGEAVHRMAVRRDFRAALTRIQPAIIAEIKKASPSKGVLVADFDPSKIAQAYASGGAAALSVLTDEPGFQGCLGDLEMARAAVDLPVLRKDFTVDEFHVIEGAAHGADAILLIAAILTERQLRSYRELAAKYKMAALVEVHDAEEVKLAVDSGAQIIGVNNRNLHTFEVSLEVSLRLADSIPANVTRVTESGIHSADDVRRLRTAGFQAFLVGEHLMRSDDPAGALRRLLV
jgi:indole-3-glycerol phosphate synthase